MFKSSAIAGGKTPTVQQVNALVLIRNHFLILPNQQVLKADSQHHGAL